MSTVGILSTRMFNMGGLEIDKTGEVISHGQIFFGSDFIVKYENGTSKLFIQNVANGEPTKTVNLKGKTDRSLRIETNKINPQYKHQKPRIITRTEYFEKLNIQNGGY